MNIIVLVQRHLSLRLSGMQRQCVDRHGGARSLCRAGSVLRPALFVELSDHTQPHGSLYWPLQLSISRLEAPRRRHPGVEHDFRVRLAIRASLSAIRRI